MNLNIGVLIGLYCNIIICYSITFPHYQSRFLITTRIRAIPHSTPFLRALKLNKGSIPESRIAELEQIIKDHFGVETVTEELLDTSAKMDAR